jgi:signal transduction histidine kinase
MNAAVRTSKILIVEDEGIVAFNLQQRLEQLGYRITGLAESGAEGLALVAQERPDLVLMDIHIKGEMDGIELAAALNRDFALPVIYLTAYSEDTTLERARRTRPYGYLIKPFSERELHATVQMALERHAVQAALAESQALLRQALDAARMGRLELRPDRQRLRLSGPPAAVIGLAPDTDHPVADFLARISAEDQAPLIDDWSQRSPRQRTVRVVGGSDGDRWLQLDTLANEDGLVQGVIQDVSEREQARLALQHVNEELEERVMERTAELRQHVRELEAFSRTAAHDLRSPVRAVSGLSEILIETHAEHLGDDGREMLERMAHAAQRMGELIDALLRLSKLSHAPLYRVDADLSAMAHEVAQSLREAEPQRQVEFHIAEGLHTLADRPLIRSVIDNLVRNAWKFSREREVARIEVGQVQRQGRTDFFVRDNGCGFDMGQASRLFSAFYRLHDEQRFGGSGLGLSIAQRIVQRHGGDIWAEGERERGATIYFTLGD